MSSAAIDHFLGEPTSAAQATAPPARRGITSSGASALTALATRSVVTMTTDSPTTSAAGRTL